ncbi:hypothetical protein LUZ60_001142 [Juncus effusus]|nr:hypothetical protein LUZ60_001142 [Juncus effusus]
MDSVLLDTVINSLFNGGGAQGGGKDRAQGEEREANGSVPMDILETQKEYVFYLDVPGLSKSDIQVTLEEGKVLVMKSNAKRKREEDEEGCKYLRLERRGPVKFQKKFRLAEDANLDAISARYENGVLIVTVPKLPPPEKKTKTIQVKVA